MKRKESERLSYKNRADRKDKAEINSKRETERDKRPEEKGGGRERECVCVCFNL